MTQAISSASQADGINDPFLLEDRIEEALKQEANIGLLIVRAFQLMETASHDKSRVKLDELERLQHTMQSVTDLLSGIDTQLAEKSRSSIEVAPELRNAVGEILKNNPLFAKTKWSRDEAQSIQTVLTRHSQVLMQEVQHSSSELNRALESGTELLQIARKCLELLQQLHQTFTSNQRR